MSIAKNVNENIPMQNKFKFQFIICLCNLTCMSHFFALASHRIVYNFGKSKMESYVHVLMQERRSLIYCMTMSNIVSKVCY